MELLLGRIDIRGKKRQFSDNSCREVLEQTVSFVAGDC